MGTIGLAVALLAVARVPAAPDGFDGAKAGEAKAVAGVKLCWCPPGKFTMGSPRGEPERRPGEDQVEVTLTRGFWAGKYEVTQGDWKRVVGKLPGPLTAELPEGDDYPVGNVNFAEAEGFCRSLTESARAVGRAPGGLGVPPADGVSVGIRMSGGDDDGDVVWRLAESQASELHGQALQRRRAGAVARQGGRLRPLPGEPVGPARHARQHLRVVPRLVPRPASRRRRP